MHNRFINSAAIVVGAVSVLIWRQSRFERRLVKDSIEWAEQTNKQLEIWLKHTRNEIEKAFKDINKGISMMRRDNID